MIKFTFDYISNKTAFLLLLLLKCYIKIGDQKKKKLVQLLMNLTSFKM